MDAKLNESETTRKTLQTELAAERAKVSVKDVELGSASIANQEHQRKLSEMEAKLNECETTRVTLQAELQFKEAMISVKDIELAAAKAEMQGMKQENSRSAAEMQRIEQANSKGVEELAAANKALDEQRVLSQRLTVELSMAKLLAANMARMWDKETIRVKDLEHRLDTLDLIHTKTLRISEAREVEISYLNDSIDELKDECNTVHLGMKQMSGDGEFEVSVVLRFEVKDLTDTFSLQQAKDTSMTEELNKCRIARETIETKLVVERAKHKTLLSTHQETLDKLKDAQVIMMGVYYCVSYP
jgi:hypothetical protein